MLAEMRRQGLNTDHVQQRQDKTVGLYMIDTDADGERSFTYWRNDSAARYLFEQKPPEVLAQELQPDLIYLSGISLAILPEHDRSALLTWLTQQSAPVAFDPNYRPRLWSDQAMAQIACAQAAKLSTYLLTSLDDDMALWGLSTMDEAMALWQLQSDAELVIKNGAGAIRLCHSEMLDVVPVSVESPLDTTGAGDAFNGAYLGSRLMGVTPADAAKAASELCALVVMCRGAILPL
jgi:2-dehydro-3-deoxygluconokinase